MLPIRIIDQDFNLLGEIDKYSSLQMSRSAYGIGICELRINRYMQYADKLQRRNIIFPTNQTHKAYMILHKEIELDENGKVTENWIIKAYQLKVITAQRTIYPTVSQATNSINGNAESVIKHFINTEMVTPTDVSRIYESLVIADNLNRGTNTYSSASYEDNLSEKLAEISTLTQMGWDITLDLQNKKFIVDVIPGLDRSANQSIIPPAIFSTDYETLKSMSYSESEIDFKNVAIVGGDGEGAARQIVTVGNAVGRERYEIFVEASNEELTLQQVGQNALSEHTQTIYCEGQVLTNSMLKYERDYDLNDIVTLQNKLWGITMDTRITEIKEVHEPGKYNIELTFDNDRPTLIAKIKSELRNIKRSIS